MEGEHIPTEVLKKARPVPPLLCPEERCRIPRRQGRGMEVGNKAKQRTQRGELKRMEKAHDFPLLRQEASKPVGAHCFPAHHIRRKALHHSDRPVSREVQPHPPVDTPRHRPTSKVEPSSPLGRGQPVPHTYHRKAHRRGVALHSLDKPYQPPASWACTALPRGREARLPGFVANAHSARRKSPRPATPFRSSGR